MNSPPRKYPPRNSPPRKYPPRNSPPRKYPPRNSPPRKYPPRNSPPRNSPPRNSPPRKYPALKNPFIQSPDFQSTICIPNSIFISNTASSLIFASFNHCGAFSGIFINPFPLCGLFPLLFLVRCL